MPDITGSRSEAGAMALAVAACLLSAAGPTTASGMTCPIAEGVSGPYEYQVGIGPFSPPRRALFVAVTLMAGDNPVIDADVAITGSVDVQSVQTTLTPPAGLQFRFTV